MISHELRIPCLTTPSPSEAGRPPRKRMKGKVHPEQKARRLVTTGPSPPGNMQKKLYFTEQMVRCMCRRPGSRSSSVNWPLTTSSGVSERVRHRLLANGWHFGTARSVMMMVLHVHCRRRTGSNTSHVCSPDNAADSQPLPRWTADPVCVPQADFCGITGLWHAQRSIHAADSNNA